MTFRPAPLRFALALSVAGCSFTEIPPAPGSVAVNSCSEDDECGGGRCRGNICVSTSTTLRPLLVEVTPPTNIAEFGGLPFYARLERPAGDIAIGPVGRVTAAISATVDPGCSFQGPPPDRLAFAPSGGTIPANVLFVPSERVLGMSTPTYVAATGAGDDFVIGGRYQSTTSLPVGDYDIYIEPRAVSGVVPEATPCELPPLLVRRQVISGTVMLGIELPPASLLDLVVQGPAGDESLKNWSVAVLDSASGRLLSVPRTLPAPTFTEASSEYSLTGELALPFVPAHVVEDGELKPDANLAGHEVVRLSPPDDIIAPSFFFQRDGLRLSEQAAEVVDLSPPDGYSSPAVPVPVNVTIEGQTSELDTGLPVAAPVTLVSSKLDGTSSQASYTTTIQVDETGTFRADVPPGTYSVRATPPPLLGLSAAETEWQIRASSDIQAGKTIELPRAPFVSGDAFVNGVAVFGATASAVVSPLSAPATVLQRTLSAPPPVPRASAGLVEKDGHFEIGVDPGIYDFFIRPEARSSYPWLVLPHVDVPEGGLNLLRRKLTLPFVYRGAVVVDATTTRVPGALIRAYVYVTATGEYTSDVTESAAVIPVAEARADENGAFELLIPASLDKR